MKYNHKKIETNWQRIWDKKKLYATSKNPRKGKKRYVLDMFPYPSGAGLHVGHPEGYTATDIYSRYLRMNGYDVLHPMGWDAFGLPAENYAIQKGVHPAKTTASNIKRFREQIKSLGLSYDWDREIDTSDPVYYKWTQWLFLKLYEKGLAYRKEANVNWCPKDQTVLANEQVINGRCHRCDSEVVQKLLPQWFFKITDYADRLLEGLDHIDWPEPIKLMQRNWIGKSEGAELEFGISNLESGIKRFVLLHGKGSSPDKVFLPWLKENLEKKGFEVQVPAMPGGDTPNDMEQMAYAKTNCTFDESTVVLGHSFGGVVALRLLEQGIRMNKVILVGTPFSGVFLDGKVRESVLAAVRKGFNFGEIKKNAKSFVTLYDLHDHVVPIMDGRSFSKYLNSQHIEAVGEKSHFDNTVEPAIFNAVVPSIKVFTTRPDTIFGATYMVLAPENPLIKNIEYRIENRGEVREYIEKAKKKTELQRTALEKEKTGIELKGVKAINPATKEEIPVWIADYVLMGYGTGAIMAVPAHDERDFEFAKKYGLKVVEVVKGGDIAEEAYLGEGELVNSGKYNGLDSKEARKKITADLGKEKIQYKLRDWLISRQRYWGAPIPIIHCDNCGKMYPVPEKDLPVKLPTDVDFRPTGESPLARSKSFNKVKCPNCKKPARRETDTMDTFVDSSWYWLRYTDPKNSKKPFDKLRVHQWCPVDTYVGGAEHAVLHLMYARFISKVLSDMGYVKFNGSTDEPFAKLRNQGLILGPDGQKMSKSRGNVINPDDVVSEFGADTMRMYEMFMGPLEDAKPWSTQGIRGVKRFLDKVWRLFEKHDASPHPSPLRDLPVRQAGRRGREGEVENLLHRTIKKVTEDIVAFKFNTAVSAMMILVNEFSTSSNSIGKKQMEAFLKILAPFAPHLAEELWLKLGHKTSIHKEKWPKYDENLIKENLVSIIVQVNGRVRSTMKVVADSDEEHVREMAQADSNVKKHLEGKEIKKVIYIPGKIINYVIKESGFPPSRE